MNDELREKVARSICCVNGECYRPDKCYSWTFGGEADAVIAIIRGETLEEAARVAERASRHPVGAGDGGTYVTGTAIDAAAAIRALKDKP